METRRVEALKILRGRLDERGSGVLTVLAIMVVLDMLLLVAARLATTAISSTFQDQSATAAFHAAEAGLNHVMFAVNKNPNYNTGERLPAANAGGYPDFGTQGERGWVLARAATSPNLLNLTSGETVYIKPTRADGTRDAVLYAVGYVPSRASARAVRAVKIAADGSGGLFRYGWASSGTAFGDEVRFAAQPGGRHDAYNGGPNTAFSFGTFTRGEFVAPYQPSGSASIWIEGRFEVSPVVFPLIDFTRYRTDSSVTVVDLTPCANATTGVVVIDPADGTCAQSRVSDLGGRLYYCDCSLFIHGVSGSGSFVATHDIKNNATRTMTRIPGYPFMLAGGYIYMDTDSLSTITGLIYSDGTHACPENRTFPRFPGLPPDPGRLTVNALLPHPPWVGHVSNPGTPDQPQDLVYVESNSQILGAVWANVPACSHGRSLRLFGGGGGNITYDMSIGQIGLPNFYYTSSSGAGMRARYRNWREL